MEFLGIGYNDKNNAHVLRNCYTFLEEPEKDWTKMVQETKERPPEPSLFD